MMENAAKISQELHPKPAMRLKELAENLQKLDPKKKYSKFLDIVSLRAHWRLRERDCRRCPPPDCD